MFAIKACEPPEIALLNVYSRSKGCYSDCYVTHVRATVDLCRFVTAFYTTSLFRLERAVLGFAVSRPSTDHQARQLAKAQIDRFAAWQVEQRTDVQLLMCDVSGRTRSWFMIDPVLDSSGPKTLLYFGSAVVPLMDEKTGTPTLAFGFRALLGFHRLYSRALLSAARSRLRSRMDGG